MENKIGLIVAHDKNRLIGVDNKLPWKIKEEINFFKEVTTDNIIIMGSKTYCSLGRPLPNRINIVLTSSKIEQNNLYSFNNVEDCLNFCKKLNLNKEILVIGGESIYNYFLLNNLIDYMYVSLIDATYEQKGKCSYFPEIQDILWDKKLILKKDLFEVYYYKKK